MIKAQINREDGQTQVLVIGHADYADKGKDIVCAGVSALTQTYVLEMETEKCKRLLIEDGVMDCVCIDSKENDIRLSYLKKGLESIQSQFPHYLSLEVNKKIV